MPCSDFNTIRQVVEQSNAASYQHRQKYIIQEQATLFDLWEQVACKCKEECECKKYGCKTHWKLKEDVTFERFVDGLSRMFVPGAIKLLDDNGSPLLNIGVMKKSIPGILTSMRAHWEVMKEIAFNHNKTLICSDWSPTKWNICNEGNDRWGFCISESVYKSKINCLLFPDICVSYDTPSRKKIIPNCLNGRADISYYSMLEILRSKLLEIFNHTNNKNTAISEFKKLDVPGGNNRAFSPALIKRNILINYGAGFVPSERPISRVIDKYFYLP